MTKAIIGILVAFVGVAFGPAAVASNPVETHRLITATALAQRCLGFRPTAIDEIKLARAVRPEVDAPVSAMSINSVIKSLSRSSGTHCDSPEAVQGELIFKDEVLPLLRDEQAGRLRKKG